MQPIVLTVPPTDLGVRPITLVLIPVAYFVLFRPRDEEARAG